MPSSVFGIKSVLGLEGRYLGPNCTTDTAYTRLKRAAERLDEHTAFRMVADAVRNLEDELNHEGIPHEFSDPWGSDDEGVVQPEGGVEEAVKRDRLYGELDDLAAAYFMTMQTRLMAVWGEYDRFYRRDCKLTVQCARKNRTALFKPIMSIWATANCVKHMDEWNDILTDPQTETLHQMVALGVAQYSPVRAERFLTPFVAAKAALMIAGVDKLSDALMRITVLCTEFTRSLLSSMEDQFVSHQTDLDACRKDHYDRRIREWKQREQDDR